MLAMVEASNVETITLKSFKAADDCDTGTKKKKKLDTSCSLFASRALSQARMTREYVK